MVVDFEFGERRIYISSFIHSQTREFKGNSNKVIYIDNGQKPYAVLSCYVMSILPSKYTCTVYPP